MELTKMAENLGLDTECILELLKLYIETTSKDLENAQTAIQKSDLQQVHLSMHSIKGASGNLGFSDLFEIAKAIDDRAIRNALDNLDPLIRDFRSKFEELVTVFGQYGLELDPPPENGSLPSAPDLHPRANLRSNGEQSAHEPPNNL